MVNGHPGLGRHMNSRRLFLEISRTISETGEISSNNDRLLRQADKYGTEIAEIIDLENMKISN